MCNLLQPIVNMLLLIYLFETTLAYYSHELTTIIKFVLEKKFSKLPNEITKVYPC